MLILTSFKVLTRPRMIIRSKRVLYSTDIIIALSLLEAKRSQSISNCVHLSEVLPATKSVPLLLHTVSAILPGLSYSSCSHRLSGTVTLSHVSVSISGLLWLTLGLASFVNIFTSSVCAWAFSHLF